MENKDEYKSQGNYVVDCSAYVVLSEMLSIQHFLLLPIIKSVLSLVPRLST